MAQQVAAINITDSLGCTPLHLAAQEDQKEVVEYLLEQGASKDVKDNKGKTPLQYARERGHTEIEQVLQRKRARR